MPTENYNDLHKFKIKLDFETMTIKCVDECKCCQCGEPIFNLKVVDDE